jgi:hypothetical protein
MGEPGWGYHFVSFSLRKVLFSMGHLNLRSYLEANFFSIIMSMEEKENLKKRWNLIFFG